MSWPTRTIRDPDVRCSESELDYFKHRATVTMSASRDRFITRARTVVEGAYSEAHQAVLRCRTEGEIENIERAFNGAMRLLKGVIDVEG